MTTLKEDLLARGFDLRETHISEVYLGHDTVYKIKKPVSLGFLDFRSLEARKRYCDAEVELNRRLAPHVYRGVVPITRSGDAGYRFAGDGEVVEYAVEMQRLDDADAADARLARGDLSVSDLECIAALLAEFHRAARCDQETSQYGSVAVIEANINENFEQTRHSASELVSASEVAAIETWQHTFLQRERARFEARLRADRIRDGHGDLRLEHCYINAAGVQIIDCIEFNERFRYADVCADVAFLAMDLTWHGRTDLSEVFLAAYADAADDFDLYDVVDFYESYRAYVRAKVCSIMAANAEADSDARKRARGQARKYYLLAEACTREPLEPPRLYAVGGMIAAGKSTVASQLARLLAAPHLSADHIRKRLAGVDPLTSWKEQAFAGHYAPENTRTVYGELLRRAAIILRSGRSVVLDASYRTRADRAAVSALANSLDCELSFIECVVPDDLCRSRLRARVTKLSESDARLEMFDDFKRSFEPVTELAPTSHIRLECDKPWPETLARLRALSGRDETANDA